MSQVTTDPIADMLTRVRNAIAVNQVMVSLPYSRVKESVAKILADTNFIDNVKVEGKDKEKKLVLRLASEGHNTRITEIQRISKPGRRAYAKTNDIPVVMQGRGIVIVSTSKGIMSGDEARKNKIGGELICKVY